MTYYYPAIQAAINYNTSAEVNEKNDNITVLHGNETDYFLGFCVSCPADWEAYNYNGQYTHII
jgi:hypothetical protein